jgi:UDP-2,3-diacylglucosamine pyrophosphatase LpxH
MSTNPSIEIVVRQGKSGGTAIYFPLMSVSDLHLGTEPARAKRQSHMLEHTETDRLLKLGDIVDLIAMRHKKTWNFPSYHRQVIGHDIRKAKNGTHVDILDGNHEAGARGEPAKGLDGEMKPHRDLAGKKIYGLNFHHDLVLDAPGGERLYAVHGDVFDGSISYLYQIGNMAYTAGYKLDNFLQKHCGVSDHFSLTAKGKRALKGFINKNFEINANIMRFLDDSPWDGILYGHSHMGGFSRTDGKGKLMINDGCGTEHVDAFVMDRHGNKAVITWHKDGMEVKEPEGSGEKTSYVTWEALGVEDEFSKPATLFDDECTRQADRLIRLIYRAAPPKDRIRLSREIQRKENILTQHLIAAAGTSEGRPAHFETVKSLQAEIDLHRQRLYKIPVPRHRDANDGACSIAEKAIPMLKAG